MNPSLSTERLGNLFELTVTGPDEAEQSRTAELMLKMRAWSTEPVPIRTVACTLTPDDAEASTPCARPIRRTLSLRASRGYGGRSETRT